MIGKPRLVDFLIAVAWFVVALGLVLVNSYFIRGAGIALSWVAGVELGNKMRMWNSTFEYMAAGGAWAAEELNKINKQGGDKGTVIQ